MAKLQGTAQPCPTVIGSASGNRFVCSPTFRRFSIRFFPRIPMLARDSSPRSTGPLYSNPYFLLFSSSVFRLIPRIVAAREKFDFVCRRISRM